MKRLGLIAFLLVLLPGCAATSQGASKEDAADMAQTYVSFTDDAENGKPRKASSAPKITCEAIKKNRFVCSPKGGGAKDEIRVHYLGDGDGDGNWELDGAAGPFKVSLSHISVSSR